MFHAINSNNEKKTLSSNKTINFRFQKLALAQNYLSKCLFFDELPLKLLNPHKLTTHTNTYQIKIVQNKSRMKQQQKQQNETSLLIRKEMKKLKHWFSKI